MTQGGNMSVRSRGRCLLLISAVACAGVDNAGDGVTTVVWSGSPDFVSGDISRDGRFLSQVNWNNGDLQLVDLQSGEARDLTGEGYSGGYAWTSAISPDSRQIAAAWYLDSVNAHELRIFDVDNGGWRTVVSAVANRYYIDPVDWSESGDTILAAVQTGDRTWQLAMVSARDGSMRTVVSLGWQTPGGGHDQAYPEADLSPDARFVAWDYPASATEPTRDIFVVATEGGAESVLLSGSGSDRLLGWLPSGDGILFYSDRGGTPSIWRLRVQEGKAAGEPELVQESVHALVPLGFTQAGYAYGVATEAERVHIASIDAAGRGTGSAPTPVHGPAWSKSYAADWSHDGTRLAYVAHHAWPDPVEVLSITSPTGEVERTIPLTPALHTSNGTFRWVTEDKLYFFAYERGLDGIYVMDVRAGTWRRVDTPASVGRAAIKWFEVSADGRTLYLIGRAQARDRGNEIVALDTETGAVRVVGTARAVRASLALSPAGDNLAFLARGDSSGVIELRIGPTNGSGRFRAVNIPVRGRIGPPVTWTPDGSRIVFELAQGDDSTSLWSINVAGGEPVGVLSKCCAESILRLHPDGKRIAFASGRDRGEVRVLKMR
jgi:Tol biopolymer transport system component